MRVKEVYYLPLVASSNSLLSRNVIRRCACECNCVITLLWGLGYLDTNSQFEICSLHGTKPWLFRPVRTFPRLQDNTSSKVAKFCSHVADAINICARCACVLFSRRNRVRRYTRIRIPVSAV